MTQQLMKRHLPVLSLSLLVFSALVGCQTGSGTSADYPAPFLSAQRMAPQQAVPMVAVAPAYHPNPAFARIVPTNAHTALAPTTPMTGIPVAWIPPVTPRQWKWIVVHHSATTTGGAAEFDKMHKAKGWDELGYDFVIGNGSDTGNGQIEVGPRWTKQKIGAHAKSSDNRFNEYGIGICLVGNFDVERPTPQQIASLEHLMAYLMITYHIGPDEIMGHNDTKATDCPGKYLNIGTIRRDVVKMLGPKALKFRPAPKSELLTDVSALR